MAAYRAGEVEVETFSCTVCGTVKPTSERSHGLQQCKPCVAARKRRGYLDRREEVLARQRARRAANRDARAKYERAYYAANRERLYEVERARIERDPAAHARRRRAYRQANPERIAEDARRYQSRRRGAPVVERVRHMASYRRA